MRSNFTTSQFTVCQVPGDIAALLFLILFTTSPDYGLTALPPTKLFMPSRRYLYKRPLLVPPPLSFGLHTGGIKYLHCPQGPYLANKTLVAHPGT